MRERLRIFFNLALLWLCFMIVARVIFLTYNHDNTSSLTISEILLSMLHGLRMDASICGYFLAVYGLLLTISAFVIRGWLIYAMFYLTVILLVVCSLLVSVDMELYRHWGFRMNTTPLMYVGTEALGSVSSVVDLKISFTFILLLLSFLYVFKRKIFPRIRFIEEVKHPVKAAAILFVLSSLMFLPIRGSFTVAPMNTGFVYFHNTKAFANHSAVNVIWNFFYSVRKGPSSDYPETFFDSDKTKTLFSSLYPSGGKTEIVLKDKHPNIILIILESFTADVVGPLGGVEGVAPYLNSLCSEGVLFSNIYSSGDRTDKGLISILSGYPAQPQGSVIKLPSKTERLPQLNRYIKNLGYKTSFIYGGDIDFANFRSYFNSSGFDQLTTLDDFDNSLYTSKWGVHDHHMFARATQELDTTSEKFFKVILTLSSHEPFDVPLDPPFRKGDDEESMFVNSCHYTDQSLKKFIDWCRTKAWWTNTLVVITADHGHRYPGNKELIQKERFHIPLVMIGGAIKTDTVIHTIGSQTDIANTLLGQIDRPSSKFIFSKDLLNENSKSFAAYYFTDGYGFVFPGKSVVYDNAGKRFLKNEGATSEEIDLTKAYQQKLFTNYNHLDK